MGWWKSVFTRPYHLSESYGNGLLKSKQIKCLIVFNRVWLHDYRIRLRLCDYLKICLGVAPLWRMTMRVCRRVRVFASVPMTRRVRRRRWRRRSWRKWTRRSRRAMPPSTPTRVRTRRQTKVRLRSHVPFYASWFYVRKSLVTLHELQRVEISGPSREIRP